MTSARLVLVVDDDETYRGTLARALERRGLQVLTAGSADEAMERARGQCIDYASVDLRMPGASGLELVRALSQLSPRPVIVVLTGPQTQLGDFPSLVVFAVVGLCSALSWWFLVVLPGRRT